MTCLFHVLFSVPLYHSGPVRPPFSYPPDDVEDGWYEELVVDSHSHVTWLVKGRGYGADSIAQVHAPQQEQELRWEKHRDKQQIGHRDS